MMRGLAHLSGPGLLKASPCRVINMIALIHGGYSRHQVDGQHAALSTQPVLTQQLGTRSTTLVPEPNGTGLMQVTPHCCDNSTATTGTASWRVTHHTNGASSWTTYVARTSRHNPSSVHIQDTDQPTDQNLPPGRLSRHCRPWVPAIYQMASGAPRRCGRQWWCACTRHHLYQLQYWCLQCNLLQCLYIDCTSP